MKAHILRRIGCELIGWNHEILSQCGEASFRQFRKLLSAISIMILIWGTIGYRFAQDYVGIKSFFGCACVSFAFMVIIVNIERVIILTVGKNTPMAIIRALLAFLMAVLGSCIFDQMIFKNDIKEALDLRREDAIQQTVAKRIKIIDADINRLEKNMDSLSIEIGNLSDEIAKRPVIQVANVSTNRTNTGQVDADGKPVIATTTSVNQQSFANPKVETLKADQELYKDYSDKISGLRADKQNIQEKVIEEYRKKPTGFIEELNATIDVISQSKWSMAFYSVLFGVLFLLECFVVSIKAMDNPCDYDTLVEKQLNIKKKVLQKTEEGLVGE